MSKVKVSIKCLVYNHEPYLRQCLDGFIMQKTDFAFEAIVHDDASTDNSAAIIREYAEKYPDIIKPIYEIENQYCKNYDSIDRIVMSTMSSDSKYIAFCEGDDYWTDPYKLQKQVDILDNNVGIGMCYTKVIRFIHEKNKFENIWGGDYINFDDLLKTNTIPTLSCLVRKDLLLKYAVEIDPNSKPWKMGDYPRWLWFAYNSSIKFLPEVTGVYRVLKKSASHSENLICKVNFIISTFDIKLFYVDKYSVSDDKFNDERTWWYLVLAILERDREKINFYRKNLECTSILDYKKRIILYLCNKYYNITYNIVRLYMKHNITGG